MKISFVMSNCPKKPTGGHKIIFEYMNYLSKNHNVTAYFGYEDSYEKFNIPIFLKRFLAKNATKFFRPRWFVFSKNIKKVCIDDINDTTIFDADIIIATDVKTAKPVYNLRKNKGNKFYFIQDFENWYVSDDYVKNTYKLEMNKIVVSKWLKDLVSSISQEKIYYVSNSINTSIFKNENVTRIPHSIVFQYRSNKAKGCKYAIEVISRLKEKYDDLQVVIISNEKKNDDIPNWCEYYFNVSQNDVSKINNRSQVFLCTSIEEGFGLPGLEAMACGCAVVSTAYEGIFEYAIDRENALLSPIKDVDAMINNVIMLFENDELRKKIVDNGMKTAKERSFKKAADEFENIIIKK